MNDYRTSELTVIDESDTDFSIKYNRKGERVGFQFRNPPDLLKALQGIDNGFARSLLQQAERGKRLSDRQLAAAERMVAEQAPKPASTVATVAKVDLQPIRDIFEKAVLSGFKRPTYRAEGLVISRASDSGSNPGALYVKDEAGEYKGKVLGVTFPRHARFGRGKRPSSGHSIRPSRCCGSLRERHGPMRLLRSQAHEL